MRYSGESMTSSETPLDENQTVSKMIEKKPSPTDKAVIDKADRVAVWPRLLFREFLALLLCSALLWIFSIFVDPPLEEMADPSFTPKVAKAPWYFLGLQELLVYFDPWIAGVMIPAIIIFALMAIPYIDSDKSHVGHYSFKNRPFGYFIFSFGLFLWFGLIIIGVYFRGPNWAWYWPWESWDIVKPPPPPTHSLSWYSGLLLIITYIFSIIAFQRWKWPNFFKQLEITRYMIVIILLILMFSVPLKIFLRLAFDIKYILETPWFNL